MRNRTTMIMVLLMGAGAVDCGGEDPSKTSAGNGASGAAFAGNWQCSIKVTASDGSTTFDEVYVGQDLGNGQISLIRSDLGCDAVKLTVSGSTASAQPGQTCNRPDGSVMSYQSYTATSDGTILKMEEHDRFSYTDSSGTFHTDDRVNTSTCYHP